MTALRPLETKGLAADYYADWDQYRGRDKEPWGYKWGIKSPLCGSQGLHTHSHF